VRIIRRTQPISNSVVWESEKPLSNAGRAPWAFRALLRLGFRLRLAWGRRFGRGGVGARVAVFHEGRVLLVRHTYLDGLYLPGGGVKRGEAPRDAAVRELFEETGLRIDAPEPFGDYAVGTVGGRVLLFTARVAATETRADGWEIGAVGLVSNGRFSGRRLPAPRRRIAEIVAGEPRSDRW